MEQSQEMLTGRLSLGAMIEKTFGPPSCGMWLEDDIVAGSCTQYRDFCYRWKAGSANYQRLEALQKDDLAGWNKFEESLGSLQSLSWKLLTSWLHADYHSEDMAHVARTAILSGLPGPCNELSQHPDFPVEARIDDSIYQHQLSELYAAEFLDFHDERPEEDPTIEYFLQLLDLRRRTATRYAISQYIAHVTYQQSNSATSAAPPISESTWHYPAPLFDVCPWLSTPGLGDNPYAGNSDEYPHFLWHIASGRTVETALLQRPRPAYTCVSHTWGRWRLDAMTDLQGVPWQLPENSIFGVQQLPAMFKELRSKICTDYLWLDLVCIPQTRDGDLGKIAKREISRQAGIFRKSVAALIWFNYVDNWAAENHLLRWLSFQYLAISTAPGLYDTAHMLDHLRQNSESPIQLLGHPQHRKYLGKEVFPIRGFLQRCLKLDPRGKGSPQDWTIPSPWFSSLWTLQEALFCPHMTLMSREWTALRDASGRPVTMERLMALCQTLNGLMKPVTETLLPVYRGHQTQLLPANLDTAYPMSASQLCNLLVDVHFDLSTSLSRTAVLVKGNARHCSGRRAEAIMSVLNILEWFDPEAEEPEENLVLGMYPLSFVKETARKLGPDFLLGRKYIGSPIHSLNYFLGRTRGSILPFESLDPGRNRGRRGVTMYPVHVYESRWHPACTGWKFLQSGSVEIKRAALLGAFTSTAFDLLVSVRVHVYWQPYPGRYENLTMVPLSHFLQEQPRIYNTFAVMLSKELGILLQGFRSKSSSYQRLIKVGCFEVRERFGPVSDNDDWIESQNIDWVPATDVDWVVL